MKILIWITVSVLAVAAVAVGAGLMLSRAARSAAEGTATGVYVEPAGRGPVVELVSVPGEVQPETKVQIGARVPAQILDLPHKEGAHVTGFEPKTAGSESNAPESAVLVRLDAKDLEASLKSAEARAEAQKAEIEVAKARIEGQKATIAGSAATLADAERELGRQESLLQTADVAQQAVDQARTKAEEQRHQLEAARHNLSADEQNLTVLGHNLKASEADIAKAREQLAYTVITSPIDGIVIKVNSKVGENVVPGIQGSPGSVILEVADLGRMTMVGRVDEASVSLVKPGQKATVRMQAYRDQVFEGTVQSVALAKADPSQSIGNRNAMETGTWFEARILLKTDGRRIFTGLNADADIETQRHEGVKVPSQAVLGRRVDSLPEEMRNRPEVEKGKQFASVVYRLINGKAVATPVKVGPSDETQTLIESGLAEGEPVIVGPFKVLDTLKDGQVVKVDQTNGPGGSGTTQPTTAPATRPATQPAMPTTQGAG